jgi:hypothetical protein
MKMRTKALEKTLELIGLVQDEQFQSEFHEELSVNLDADIKRIMACTNQLVEHALQTNWLAVLEGLDTRRKLLQSVMDAQAAVSSPRLTALCDSVSESERALMRVVAHAIASSRNNGALFSLYH